MCFGWTRRGRQRGEPVNLQSVLFMAGIVIAASTLYALRREHIRAEYSIGWLAAGAFLAAAGLFPGGMKAVSTGLINVQLGPLIAAGTLLAGLVFWTTRLVSRLKDERIMLAQKAAILEFRMRRRGTENEAEQATASVQKS
jgi:hypothetical protein